MRGSIIFRTAPLAIALMFISACGLLSDQKTSDSAAPSGQSAASNDGNTQLGPLLPSEATAAALPPGVLYADDFSNPLSGGMYAAIAMLLPTITTVNMLSMWARSTQPYGRMPTAI